MTPKSKGISDALKRKGHVIQWSKERLYKTTKQRWIKHYIEHVRFSNINSTENGMNFGVLQGK